MRHTFSPALKGRSEGGNKELFLLPLNMCKGEKCCGNENVQKESTTEKKQAIVSNRKLHWINQKSTLM